MGEGKGGENFFPNLPGHLVLCNNVESTILQTNLDVSLINRIQAQVINGLYIKDRMRSPEGKAMHSVRPNTFLSVSL